MLEKLKSKLDQGVATVSAKSESLVETTRTKNSIAAKQRQVEALKAALGDKVYTAWRAGSLSIEDFTDDLNAIAEVEAEIDGLNEHLLEIKENEAQALNAVAVAAAVNGTSKHKLCPTCGKSLPMDCRFCDSCGSPLI